MNTTDESLDAPLTGQFRSSPFYVAIGAPALASALSIICSAVCYRLLPLEAAKEQMTYINSMLLVSGGGGGLTGAWGIVSRGLEITRGKIKKQLPPEMPETVNAGTANISTGADSAEDEEPLTFDGEPENPNIEVIED